MQRMWLCFRYDFGKCIILFIKSEIQTNIFYLYTSDLLELEAQNKSEPINVTFIDLFQKLPFFNNGKLESIKCNQCKSNKELHLMRMPIDPSKVNLNNLVPGAAFIVHHKNGKVVAIDSFEMFMN